MKTIYNPDIIQEFADRLYAKANSVTRSYIALGVILLGFAGLATGQVFFCSCRRGYRWRGRLRLWERKKRPSRTNFKLRQRFAKCR